MSDGRLDSRFKIIVRELVEEAASKIPIEIWRAFIEEAFVESNDDDFTEVGERFAEMLRDALLSYLAKRRNEEQGH